MLLDNPRDGFDEREDPFLTPFCVWCDIAQKGADSISSPPETPHQLLSKWRLGSNRLSLRGALGSSA